MAIFKRREKRDNLSKWIAWLDSLGGTPASSGVIVSEESALTVSSVLAALRLLSTTIAMLPLPVYKRLDNGGKDRAYNHPLYPILHDSPNNYQTAYEFRQMMMMHILLHGNFYALIDRDKTSGRINELLPFAFPVNMEVALYGNEPLYQYQMQDGSKLRLDQTQVFHLKGMSTNGLIGLDILEKGKEPIGLAQAIQEYAAKFFASGGNISGVLEHPNQLSPEARAKLTASWSKAYGGVSNSHKVAILEEGMKYTKMGVSPEEAQALDSRKFQTIEVARIFGVPPHMIGDLERATFSNIEHQGIEFVTFCIAPWATMIEQRISKQLLNEGEKNIYFAKFSLEALMRGDYKSRQEGLNIMRQNGIINANEWRGLENFNPIAGDEGSVYLVNGNMTKPGAEPVQNTEPANIRSALIPVWDDAIHRIQKREEADIMRYVKTKKPGADELKSWLFDFYKEHETFVRKNLEPYYKALGDDKELDGKVKEYCKSGLDEVCASVAAGHDLQTVFDLRKGAI